MIDPEIIKAKLKELKEGQEWTVTFLKKDGTVRTIRCTGGKLVKDVVTIYEPSTHSFKAFHIKRVIDAQI